MAAILNSAIMDSSILHKKKHHSFFLTQLDDCSFVEICHPRFSYFAQKKLTSFILTQPDDGSHLEFCHLWLKHFHLGFKDLVIFSQTWLMAAISEFCHYGFSHLHKEFNLTQTHSFWLNLMMAAILNICHLGFSHFEQKKLHSFILTQLDDGSHLEFCHVGFSHFLSNTLTHAKLVPKSAQKNSFILTQLDDGPAILNSAILEFSHFVQKKLHSFILTQLDDGSHLELCHVGFRHCHLGFKHTCYILSDSDSKTFFTPFWLWLKLILINLTDGNHLEFWSSTCSILDLSHFHKILLIWIRWRLTQTNSFSQTHSWLTWTCQSWIPSIAQKNLHSFILTQLDDGSHLKFWLQTMLSFRHLDLLSDSLNSHSICTKKFFTHSFWLNLMMAAILNSAILDSAILHKKNFTHSFWLNLMMAAILNSAILDSDTAVLDSNTLLSSLRFTQKHSSLHSDPDSN